MGMACYLQYVILTFISNLECDGDEYEVVSADEDLSSNMEAIYIAVCCFLVIFAGMLNVFYH